MADTVRDQIVKLGSDDAAEAFRAYKAIEKIAVESAAPGKETERANVAAALAEELMVMTPATKDAKGRDVPPAPKYSATARNQICRLLAWVSGAKEVAALAKTMGDLEVREEARRALDRNCSEEATDALIKAIEEIGEEFRLGVMNSLGKRSGNKIVAALTKVASSDENPAMRINAVEALAGIPVSANATVVLKATQCSMTCHAARAWKATVRLAEKLRNSGNRGEAAKLYRKIAADAPEAQKAAARMALQSTG